MLTICAVRRRLTSTSSLSATSTPASRLPPVVSNPTRTNAYTTAHNGTDLIYKCGGIDKRTIEKFEKVRHTFLSAATAPAPAFSVREASSWGLSLKEGHFWWGCASFSQTCASLLRVLGNLNTMPHIRILHRKHHDFGRRLRRPLPLSHLSSRC